MALRAQGLDVGRVVRPSQAERHYVVQLVLLQLVLAVPALVPLSLQSLFALFWIPLTPLSHGHPEKHLLHEGRLALRIVDQVEARGADKGFACQGEDVGLFWDDLDLDVVPLVAASLAPEEVVKGGDVLWTVPQTGPERHSMSCWTSLTCEL